MQASVGRRQNRNLRAAGSRSAAGAPRQKPPRAARADDRRRDQDRRAGDQYAGGGERGAAGADHSSHAGDGCRTFSTACRASGFPIGPTIPVRQSTCADCRISGGSPLSSMARSQDFQRSGHFANGQFYLDPELIGGSGRGSRSGRQYLRFRRDRRRRRHSAPRIWTTSCLPGETQAIQSHAMFGTNGDQWLASTFGGARGPLGDIFVGGVYRDSGNFTSGAGTLTSLQCVSNCAGYPTHCDSRQLRCSLHRKSSRIRDGQADRPSRRGTSRSSSRPSLTIPATTSEIRPARGLRSRGLASMARTSAIRPLRPNTASRVPRPRSSTLRPTSTGIRRMLARPSKSPMSKTALTFPDHPGLQPTTCSTPPGLESITRLASTPDLFCRR